MNFGEYLLGSWPTPKKSRRRRFCLRLHSNLWQPPSVVTHAFQHVSDLPVPCMSSNLFDLQEHLKLLTIALERRSPQSQASCPRRCHAPPVLVTSQRPRRSWRICRSRTRRSRTKSRMKGLSTAASGVAAASSAFCPPSKNMSKSWTDHMRAVTKTIPKRLRKPQELVSSI